MRLYLKLYDMVLEILDPSMSAVREVSDRLSTLSAKYRNALDTNVIYSDDYKTEAVIYPVESVDSAILAIRHECEEIESRMSDKLEEIKQELISKLDDQNRQIFKNHKNLKVSMKVGGFRHQFEIRVKPDLITVECGSFSIAKEKLYDFRDVDKLINDFADLQKIINEMNQSLVQSAFSLMFE